MTTLRQTILQQAAFDGDLHSTPPDFTPSSVPLLLAHKKIDILLPQSSRAGVATAEIQGGAASDAVTTHVPLPSTENQEPGDVSVSALGSTTTQVEHTTKSPGSVSGERTAISGKRSEGVGGVGEVGGVGAAANPALAHGKAPPAQEMMSNVKSAGGLKAVSAELPTLPPFFSSGKACNVDATASIPTQQATDQRQTSELLETAQIQGVGNAGESVAKDGGCKCAVM